MLHYLSFSILFPKNFSKKSSGLAFLFPLLFAAFAWGQDGESTHKKHLEHPPQETAKNPSKMEKRGLQLSEPSLNFGLKFDFGSFLNEPKTVGGGLGAIVFMGRKAQFVIEGLTRIHYIFNSTYSTMFETEAKVGYLFPLSTRVGLIFKVGFGYVGFFPPTASHDTPSTSVPPAHHYLSIPLEGAILYDLSQYIDLELSPIAMPLFELDGKIGFNAGLSVSLIFHPRKLIKVENSTGSDHQHH